MDFYANNEQVTNAIFIRNAIKDTIKFMQSQSFHFFDTAVGQSLGHDLTILVIFVHL